jgi:hypothetical protein
MVAKTARKLRHKVRQIRHRLWLPRDTPVYALGGLWQIGPFLLTEFADPQWRGDGAYVLDDEALPGGRFVICTPKNDAAHGAALLAALEVL